MPEIQTEDFETISPVAEIGLARIPGRRIARKTRRDDHVRARSKQLQAGLIADLDAPAGQQRDAAPEIGQLGALSRNSGRRTAGTSDRRSDESLCTSSCRRSSAEARRHASPSDALPLFRSVCRRKDVRGVEDRLSAKRADARPGARGFIVFHALRLAFAGRPSPSAGVRAIGTVNERDGLQQPLPIFLRDTCQHRSIGRNRFEKRDGLGETFQHRRHRYASRLLDRRTASARIVTPQANSASACGHNVSRPTPFRKMPRRMTTK